MAIDVIMSPPAPNNPFEIARRKLISALAALKAPCIGSFPEPRDFEDVKAHIAEVAALADLWLRAVGNELSSNTTLNLHQASFDGAFTGAVEGWSLHECDRCADDCEEERAA